MQLKHIPPAEDSSIFTETEQMVGSYIIGEVLGEGQFATVTSCIKIGSDQGSSLALKTIKKERILSFHGLKRVSNEIDTLRKLKSPYIIHLHDVIHTTTKLYIITERGGPDLFEFFDTHPDGVSELWAKDIMYHILQGVAFCHNNSYCHRDLKPEVCNTYIYLTLHYLMYIILFYDLNRKS